MNELDLEKIIMKINGGVSPEHWYDDEESMEQELPQSSFLLVPPRRLWEQIKGLPQYKAGISNSGRGRPRRHSSKRMFCAILTKAYYALRWKEFEAMFDIPATTAFDQYRRWKKSGLFDALSDLRVQCHQGHHDIDWTWLKVFDRFKDHLEPERVPRESATASKDDERMYRRLNFTARGTPRKNRIQAHILRQVRDHFHQSAQSY